MEKEIKKEVKLNINYLRFIKELRDSKISIEKSNKEKIESLYSEIVDLRFNNIKRVDFRVKREEIKEELKEVLRNMGVKESEFKDISKKLRDLSKKNLENSYIVKKIE